MHAFQILGDPVRRRVLELLVEGERSAGELAETIGTEFGISQPAVSQHLKTLRDSGFVRVRAEGTRRLYAVEPGPLAEVDGWLDQFRGFWSQRLDALGTELARGSRAAAATAGDRSTPQDTTTHPTHDPKEHTP